MHHGCAVVPPVADSQPLLPVDERPLASGCAGGVGASGTGGFYGNFCQDTCAARSRPTGSGQPIVDAVPLEGPNARDNVAAAPTGEEPLACAVSSVSSTPSPAKRRVDMRFYSRAMLPFVTETPATTTAATSTGTTTTPTTTGSSTEVIIAGQMEGADSGNVSDAGSATTHVTFLPPKKRTMKTQPPTSS